ncbi:DUF3820 family protein [Bythopirellula polymerisocia]|uniref:Uncharacterized protein n=1 Tax=Bythopirellula polymerisocia TaxID=2528003 RepID=A0A5C6C2D0_9BACT|nr:DUF3820 family protein [Bythopirellula polymerisocia]TWU17811.1 hypothetical protein Pla144_50580 [Bythopirellula polymerisocia]
MSNYNELQKELEKLERDMGDDVSKIKKYLEELGIESEANSVGLTLACPKCKKRSINLRIKDNKYPTFKWRCYGCRISLSHFDNLIGLIRLHKNISPREAMNMLIDVVRKPKGEVPYGILIFGKYAGIPLNEVPPHYLHWVVRESKSIDDETKNKLINYLYVPSNQEEKRNPYIYQDVWDDAPF